MSEKIVLTIKTIIYAITCVVCLCLTYKLLWYEQIEYGQLASCVTINNLQRQQLEALSKDASATVAPSGIDIIP